MNEYVLTPIEAKLVLLMQETGETPLAQLAVDTRLTPGEVDPFVARLEKKRLVRATENAEAARLTEQGRKVHNLLRQQQASGKTSSWAPLVGVIGGILVGGPVGGWFGGAAGGVVGGILGGAAGSAVGGVLASVADADTSVVIQADESAADPRAAPPETPEQPCDRAGHEGPANHATEE